MPVFLFRIWIWLIPFLGMLIIPSLSLANGDPLCDQDQEKKMKILIVEGLTNYIDESYQISENELHFFNSEKQMLAEMKQMINHTLSLFQVEEPFEGFGKPTINSLSELHQLKWSQDELSILGDTPDECVAVLFAMVQVKIDRLKALCTEDFNSFYEKHAIEEHQQRIDQEIEFISLTQISSGKNKYMSPIEYYLGNSVVDAAEELDFVFPKSFLKKYEAYVRSTEKENKSKMTKKDLYAKLIETLTFNSEQLTELQKEINRLNGQFEEKQNNQYNELKYDLTLLKDKINQLEEQSDRLKIEPEFNPMLASESKKTYSIPFKINSASIDAKSQEQLNAIIKAAKRTKDLITISGYADSTGPKTYNVVLSRERAENTARYLIDHGINPARIKISYASVEEANPNYRKTEIVLYSYQATNPWSAN